VGDQERGGMRVRGYDQGQKGTKKLVQVVSQGTRVKERQ
jgi:hypothetical protein